MLYNETTRGFTLRYYTTSACISYTTEACVQTLCVKLCNRCIDYLLQIYFNKAIHYPKGYTVSITPPTAATWKENSTNYLLVTHNSTLIEGTIIQVTIRALT